MEPKIKTVVYFLGTLTLFTLLSICWSDKKPQEIIIIHQHASRPYNEQTIKDFNQIHSIFSRQEVYIGLSFLRTMNQRAQYDYLAFGKWRSIEDY
ncbi:MAG: hypothetical protein ACMUEM_06770 [Flavobacteriales bacterium AspAUS03]